MTVKRFISVSKISHCYYWDCPGKCGAYHELDKSQVPLGITCDCGYRYWAKQLTSESQGGARLLIEEEHAD